MWKPYCRWRVANFDLCSANTALALWYLLSINAKCKIKKKQGYIQRLVFLTSKFQVLSEDAITTYFNVLVLTRQRFVALLWIQNLQTQTSGYTWRNIRWPDKHTPLGTPGMTSSDQTNTDLWVYLRWNQMTRQTQTSGYTWDDIRWPDKHRPLGIPEVASGDQINTDLWVYLR
jgi:hypothetical protein